MIVYDQIGLLSRRQATAVNHNGEKMAIKRQQKREAAIAVIKAAAKKFEGTFICRDNVEAFTGGAIRARHLANLDSLGLGVPGSFKVGRRQCYPLDNLVKWLINRLEV